MSKKLLYTLGDVKIENKFEFPRNLYEKRKGGGFMQLFQYIQLLEDEPSISLRNYVLSLNKAQLWILFTVIENINYKNNIAKIVPENSTETKYLKTGYKKLYGDGCITRIKRQYYMLNPVINNPSVDYLFDILWNWNGICVPKARIAFNMPKQSMRSYDMDIDDILVKSMREQDCTNMDTGFIKDLLSVYQTQNFIDDQYQIKLDPEHPKYTHILIFLDEARDRNIIS